MRAGLGILIIVIFIIGAIGYIAQRENSDDDKKLD